VTIGGGAAGGQSIFNKMRNTNEEQLKNKLKSNFKGLI
jgi:hypothetical protein